MSSSNENEVFCDENGEICTQQEILRTAKITCESENVLPEKSRKQYTLTYDTFMTWCRNKKVHSFSENVLLAYFTELSKKYMPSSLWKEYSMLKSTLNVKNSINIEGYLKLRGFLKRNSEGYHAKQAKTFTPEEINKFIHEAPDNTFLAIKVALIMVIIGACRANEMHSMDIKDIQDLGSAMLVTIPNKKSKKGRKFTVTGNFYQICKKYADLRPANIPFSSFFLNYQNGKCISKNIGINSFGAMGKQMATFLKLPNPEMYTGHAFKRSSATLLVDADGDILSLKRHSRRTSTFVAYTLPHETSYLTVAGPSGGENGALKTYTAKKRRSLPDVCNHPTPFQALNLAEASPSEMWDSNYDSDSCPSIVGTRNLDNPSSITQNRLTNSQEQYTSTSSDSSKEFSIHIGGASHSPVTNPYGGAQPEFLPEASQEPINNKPKCDKTTNIIYCRLCLKSVDRGTLTPLSMDVVKYPGKSERVFKKELEEVEEIQKMIKLCLPFFDSLTFNPGICCSCVTSLKTSYAFISQCLQTQQIVTEYKNSSAATEQAVSLNDVIASNSSSREINTCPRNSAVNDMIQSDYDLNRKTKKRKNCALDHTQPSSTDAVKKQSKRPMEEPSTDDQTGGYNAAVCCSSPKGNKLHSPYEETSESTSSEKIFIKTEPDLDSFVSTADVKIEMDYIDYPDVAKIEYDEQMNDTGDNGTDTKTPVAFSPQQAVFLEDIDPLEEKP